jgi:heme-degrading monooxygenase HmoA
MSEESSAPGDGQEAARHAVHQLGVDDAEALTRRDSATSVEPAPADSLSSQSAGVLEVGQFEVTPGTEEDFVAGYQVARLVLATASGARSVRMTRGVESPSRFTLLVEWDSVEAHLAFRASDRFAEWRAPIGAYLAGPPHMEHYTYI